MQFLGTVGNWHQNITYDACELIHNFLSSDKKFVLFVLSGKISVFLFFFYDSTSHIECLQCDRNVVNLIMSKSDVAVIFVLWTIRLLDWSHTEYDLIKNKQTRIWLKTDCLIQHAAGLILKTQIFIRQGTPINRSTINWFYKKFLYCFSEFLLLGMSCYDSTDLRPKHETMIPFGFEVPWC